MNSASDSQSALHDNRGKSAKFDALLGDLQTMNPTRQETFGAELAEPPCWLITVSQAELYPLSGLQTLSSVRS